MSMRWNFRCARFMQQGQHIITPSWEASGLLRRLKLPTTLRAYIKLIGTDGTKNPESY